MICNFPVEAFKQMLCMNELRTIFEKQAAK